MLTELLLNVPAYLESNSHKISIHKLIMDQISKIKHLYARAGFGIPTTSWKSYRKKDLSFHIDQLFQQANNSPNTLGTADYSSGMPRDLRQLSEEERKNKLKENQQAQIGLNLAWIKQMHLNQNPLLEKMAFFWHDHFACRTRLYPVLLTHIETIRKHALGNFKDLLFAVSKDAGMIRFLNNQQNRKEHPNENFGRELMELFTLGRGQYSELDVKEAARAFTGWSSNFKGEFVFRPHWHDAGQKEFLGKKGNFDGIDILNIILEQRQTARFVVEKLYKFLVNPTIQPDIIETWANDWYENDYNISYLLRQILTSEHFYAPHNIAARIKTPIEYLVSLMQILQLSFETPEAAIFVQKVLGQILFVPPNVSGWPEGTAWIDSTTLMARLHIPLAFISGNRIAIAPKRDFSSNEDPINISSPKEPNVSIDWTPLMKLVKDLKKEEIVEELTNLCLHKYDANLDTDSLHTFIPNDNPEQQVKAIMARLLSTPEFNIC